MMGSAWLGRMQTSRWLWRSLRAGRGPLTRIFMRDQWARRIAIMRRGGASGDKTVWDDGTRPVHEREPQEQRLASLGLAWCGFHRRRCRFASNAPKQKPEASVPIHSDRRRMRDAAVQRGEPRFQPLLLPRCNWRFTS